MTILLDDLKNNSGDIYLDNFVDVQLGELVQRVGTDSGTYNSPNDTLTEIDTFTGEITVINVLENSSLNIISTEVSVSSSDIGTYNSPGDALTEVDTFTGEIGIFTFVEEINLSIEGTIPKVGTDLGTFGSISTSSVVSFDPLRNVLSVDSGTFGLNETSDLVIFDAARNAIDSSNFSAIETALIDVSGTVELGSADIVNLNTIERGIVGLSISSSDLGTFVEVNLPTNIEVILYNPGWEEDEVTWGGVLLGAKDAAPIFIKDANFGVVGRGNTPLNGFLERKAVVNGENNFIIGLGVYPQFSASTGNIIKVWLGGHNEPEGEIDWEGPYDFIVGEDEYVDFAVTGKYLAVRFETETVPTWSLQSFRVEYKRVGRH